MWFRYFLIYILIFFLLIYIFFSSRIYKVVDIKDYSIRNFLVVILLLTFRGLPPFRIFIIKFYVVLVLLRSERYLITIMLIFSSLLRVYYYLRIRLDYYIFFNYKKIFKKPIKNELVILLIFLVNFILIVRLSYFMFI